MWPEQDRWRAPVGDFPPPWASAWGDDEYGLWADLTVNGVTQRMRWIEPTDEQGFLIGAQQTERDRIKDATAREWATKRETEPTPVVIPSGFWLADTPCTQALWAAVMKGDTPSRFKVKADSAQRPVERVSFDDVGSFLAALRALVPISVALPPTEAQWEYACRAGTTTAYWWGDAIAPNRANVAESHLGETTPVHAYAPNAFGLYDMHGNVWEWCADPWRNHTPVDASAAGGGGLRVVRGGSWSIDAGRARSAYRGIGHADGDPHDQGFRFLLRSQSPTSQAGGR